jgi:hypothetical protein
MQLLMATCATDLMSTEIIPGLAITNDFKFQIQETTNRAEA